MNKMKKTHGKFLIKIYNQTTMVFVILWLSSCFAQQLRPGAGSVRILYQDSDSRKCRLVSQIDTGNFDVNDYQDAQVVLRNIAYQMGANAIQIENIQAGKIASAKALRCTGKILDRAAIDSKSSDSVDSNNANDNNKSDNSDSSDNTENTDSQNLVSDGKLTIQGDIVISGNNNWQRCGYGQFFANNTCQGSNAVLNWKAAMNHCNNLQDQGKVWRLPTTVELQSLIINNTNSNIRIDLVAFPRSEASLYWTSSLYEKSNQVAWTVDFKSGTSFAYGAANTAYLRCISQN